MNEWFKLDLKRQKLIFDQVSSKTGLPAFAVEKDWWVTQSLKAIFDLDIGRHMIFKGGTSLSKSWNLIERFSEDIDLCIDRQVLGFKGTLSKSQISKLRKASCKFTSEDLPSLLESKLKQIGLKEFQITIQETYDTDKDPQILEIHYTSITEPIPYIFPKVIVEVGARSLLEPTENRGIQSIISAQYPEANFSEQPFSVPTVVPKRTFLEKIFLLHEEFQKQSDKIRTDRMSRHHYDLEKLMDTNHGIDALKDKELYKIIVNHRSKFNLIRGINYDLHSPDNISIIPPESKLIEWEKDYKAMRENMIYGNSLNYEDLIKRITELESRIRAS